MGDAQHIIEIAKVSAVRRYNWKDRGVAPLGYIVGMALAYADPCEGLRDGDKYVQAIAAPLANDGEHDVPGTGMLPFSERADCRLTRLLIACLHCLRSLSGWECA